MSLQPDASTRVNLSAHCSQNSLGASTVVINLCRGALVNVTNPWQYSPHQRCRRCVANPRYARHLTDARRTDGTLGLNLAIPSAVRSGFRSSGFRLLGLRCLPLGATLRAFKAARHHLSGRFRSRKLVGSGRYSKCFFCRFFAGGQYFRIIACFPLLSPAGHAAHHQDRHVAARAQALPPKTKRQRPVPGRCRVRRPKRRQP